MNEEKRINVASELLYILNNYNLKYKDVNLILDSLEDLILAKLKEKNYEKK